MGEPLNKPLASGLVAVMYRINVVQITSARKAET